MGALGDLEGSGGDGGGEGEGDDELDLGQSCTFGKHVSAGGGVLAAPTEWATWQHPSGPCYLLFCSAGMEIQLPPLHHTHSARCPLTACCWTRPP